jgi:hypothetical protein
VRISSAQMVSFKNRFRSICPDDNVAMMKAKQLVDGHHVELWQRTRKIARFEPKTGHRQRMFRA